MSVKYIGNDPVSGKQIFTSSYGVGVPTGWVILVNENDDLDKSASYIYLTGDLVWSAKDYHVCGTFQESEAFFQKYLDSLGDKPGCTDTDCRCPMSVLNATGCPEMAKRRRGA